MILAILGALIIGLSLGLLGSGGSTLTVPVLVYVVGHTGKVAIAETMMIVCLISIASAIPYARGGQVVWRHALAFGLPGVGGTIIGAAVGGVSRDELQLIVLGLVMIVAAVMMWRQVFRNPDIGVSAPAQRDSQQAKANDQNSPATPTKDSDAASPRSFWRIAFDGFVVGALTGFVGVGGGFLIVPALVVLGKLPMRKAIGTSLIIIVMKSLVGFATYQYYLSKTTQHVDWSTIALFSIVGILAGLLGQRLNTKLNPQRLQLVFAIFIVVIGGYVVIRESYELFG